MKANDQDWIKNGQIEWIENEPEPNWTMEKSARPIICDSCLVCHFCRWMCRQLGFGGSLSHTHPMHFWLEKPKFPSSLVYFGFCCFSPGFLLAIQLVFSSGKQIKMALGIGIIMIYLRHCKRATPLLGKHSLKKLIRMEWKKKKFFSNKKKLKFRRQS